MTSSRPIDLKTQCINFGGYTDKDGYGHCTYKGQGMTAHRAAYIKAYGADSVLGLDVDHMCENRSCVNIFHLQAITHKENLAKSKGISAVNARKTHCIRGHEFTIENTYSWKSARECRECHRQRDRKRYREKRDNDKNNQKEE